MEKRKFNQKGRMILISIFMTLIFAAIISCTGQNTYKKVFEAYTLRINGHADSAKVLLQQISSENSENAMAWYELCRTTQQLGMANPRVIKESLGEALNYINKAINIEPENACYLSHKGRIETRQFYLAIQMGNENAAEYLEKLEETYNDVLKLDPSYYENKLTLVEFFWRIAGRNGGQS